MTYILTFHGKPIIQKSVFQHIIMSARNLATTRNTRSPKSAERTLEYTWIKNSGWKTYKDLSQISIQSTNCKFLWFTVTFIRAQYHLGTEYFRTSAGTDISVHTHKHCWRVKKAGDSKKKQKNKHPEWWWVRALLWERRSPCSDRLAQRKAPSPGRWLRRQGVSNLCPSM